LEKNSDGSFFRQVATHGLEQQSSISKLTYFLHQQSQRRAYPPYEKNSAFNALPKLQGALLKSETKCQARGRRI
jgi:hypothetical protein